jgi:predicted amidohydrolase
MTDVRVALAQIAPRLGDVQANLELHLEAIERAREAGAGVVAFPELSLTGYLLRDQVPEVALREDAPLLERLREASRGIDVVLGFVEETATHRFHNACAYLSGGRTLHVHRKVYLPTYGMFDEGRDFARGGRFRAFDSPHGRAGLLVCEDAWHATSAWLLAHQGALVLYVPSSGPTRGAKPEREITSVAVWRELLQATAQFQTAFVVYVNRVGCEDGLTFGGGSFVMDPFGRTIASLPPLDGGLLIADLEGEVLRRARTAYPLLRDSDLELVHRELERLRRLRYDLPEEPEAEDRPGPGDPGPRP